LKNNKNKNNKIAIERFRRLMKRIRINSDFFGFETGGFGRMKLE
jgi:hypothetical protein